MIFTFLGFAGAASAEKRFTCPKCFKTYKHKQNFKVHVNKECGQDPKLQCPYCDHKTHRKYSMKLHVKVKHNFS